MAPSDERQSPKSNSTVYPNVGSVGIPHYEPPPKPPLDRKTVAFAVNYEPSMVDRYWQQSRKSVKLAGGFGTAATTPTPVTDGTESNDRDVVVMEEDTNQDMNGAKRRSLREQKQRSVNMTPVKVRYDMELVPLVDRTSTQFWGDIVTWPPRPLKDPTPPPIPSPTARTATPTPSPIQPPLEASPPPMVQEALVESPIPNSVIWKPLKRKDWEDSVSELTAVCTSAALRKYNPYQNSTITDGSSTATTDATKKPQAFVPPLSREYIRDRIDIDDPLRGYQIRHRTGGWLQGFILWTNFTTWTHFFTWDSLHAEAGLAETPHVKDADGALSRELEALPRHGDPSDSGIVFEKVAEIALLGGLGCGELLLRMALEEIIQQGQYKFVVLQATTGSRSFYERFGFQRVGAVCRYGNTPAPNSASTSSPNSEDSSDRVAKPVSSTTPTLDNPIQGYRHWTHANESQQSLDLHGGPSYMMCLRLPDDPIQGMNLLERLQPCMVEEKPTVESLGAASTPNVKRKLRKQASSGSTGWGSTPPLPNLSTSSTPITPALPPLPMSAPKTKRPLDNVEATNTSKRRKVTLEKIELSGAMPSSPPTSSAKPPSYSLNPPSAAPAPTASNKLPTGQPSLPAATPTPKVRKSKPKTPNAGGKSNKTPQATPKKGTSAASKSTSTSKKNKTPTPAAPTSNSSPGTTVVHNQVVPRVGLQKVDRTTLVKQKVKSYPRDRLHYYNKVVQRKGVTNPDGPFYFVLHYNEAAQQLTLCPMMPKGILSGKRQGRPRYQCVLESSSSNWLSASTDVYDPVPAFMVMKTPLIAQEAWDIKGEP